MLDALVAEARARWGHDLSAGLQVVAGARRVAARAEPSRPALRVPLAQLSAEADRPGVASTVDAAGPPSPLPGRHGPRGRDALALLERLYPGDALVARLGPAGGSEGTGGSTTVEQLRTTDLAGPLSLPPIAPEAAVAGPWAMPFISNRLRQPDGCPWDREQTHSSLRKHLLEEAYEVYDALEGGATPELAGEIGGLLLQVVLHAQLAAQEGVFYHAHCTDRELRHAWRIARDAMGRKSVRRHPLVFGDAVARTAADVNRQWERIKADERAADLAPDGARSPLDGISASIPALAASQD